MFKQLDKTLVEAAEGLVEFALAASALILLLGSVFAIPIAIGFFLLDGDFLSFIISCLILIAAFYIARGILQIGKRLKSI